MILILIFWIVIFKIILYDYIFFKFYHLIFIFLGTKYRDFSRMSTLSLMTLVTNLKN